MTKARPFGNAVMDRSEFDQLVLALTAACDRLTAHQMAELGDMFHDLRRARSNLTREISAAWGPVKAPRGLRRARCNMTSKS